MHGVVADAAVEYIILGHAVERVGRPVAGELIGEFIATERKGFSPRDEPVLDICCESIGFRIPDTLDLDCVNASIRVLDHRIVPELGKNIGPVNRVENVGVVIFAARQRVVTQATDQRVGAAVTNQCVIARAAVEPVIAIVAEGTVGRLE